MILVKMKHELTNYLLDTLAEYDLQHSFLAGTEGISIYLSALLLVTISS